MRVRSFSPADGLRMGKGAGGVGDGCCNAVQYKVGRRGGGTEGGVVLCCAAQEKDVAGGMWCR